MNRKLERLSAPTIAGLGLPQSILHFYDLVTARTSALLAGRKPPQNGCPMRLDGDLAVFHAGRGITAMSEPQAEYEETLAKAERIFDAFHFQPSGAF
ncbi:hypothetical protein ACVI1I_006526 [Bradyrhizobium sp. USDA 4459]